MSWRFSSIYSFKNDFQQFIETNLINYRLDSIRLPLIAKLSLLSNHQSQSYFQSLYLYSESIHDQIAVDF